MVPFLRRCDTLKGVLGAVEKKCIFQHIRDTLKGTWNHRFHQESVHRYSLGCSTYLDVDF